MMRMSTIAIGGACAALLGACTSTLDEARTMKPTGTEFARALHKGYIDLAKQELDETDLKDARLFALRARSAGLGNPEPVEPMEARRIAASQRDALARARERLVKALGAGAPEKDPKRAATAQLMYECWAQEQEENIQPRDIAACRSGFEQAMAGLDSLLAAKPRKAAVVIKPPAAFAAKPAATETIGPAPPRRPDW